MGQDPQIVWMTKALGTFSGYLPPVVRRIRRVDVFVDIGNSVYGGNVEYLEQYRKFPV
jgi:hypothetical protein